MSLFDDTDDQLLTLAFNKPSEKKADVIMARRLCKALGIDFSSLDRTASGKNALLSQVIEKFVDMNPSAFKAVKKLMPSAMTLAHEVRHVRPKTAASLTATLRGMTY